MTKNKIKGPRKITRNASQQLIFELRQQIFFQQRLLMAILLEAEGEIDIGQKSLEDVTVQFLKEHDIAYTQHEKGLILELEDINNEQEKNESGTAEPAGETGNPPSERPAESPES